MHYNPTLPIYQQVEMDILKDMLNGTLHPGEKMLSARDLAVKYKINPNTASRVYQELELKGLCFTKRGMGTFVSVDEGILKTERENLAREYTKDYLRKMMGLSVSVEKLKEYIEEGINDSSYELI